MDHPGSPLLGYHGENLCRFDRRRIAQGLADLTLRHATPPPEYGWDHPPDGDEARRQDTVGPAFAMAVIAEECRRNPVLLDHLRALPATRSRPCAGDDHGLNAVGDQPLRDLLTDPLAVRDRRRCRWSHTERVDGPITPSAGARRASRGTMRSDRRRPNGASRVTDENPAPSFSANRFHRVAPTGLHSRTRSDRGRE